MTHHSDFESALRAEDGMERNRRLEALYEGVLIPCGFVAAIVLILIIALFFHR